MTWMPIHDILEERPPMGVFRRRDFERPHQRRILAKERAAIVRRIVAGDRHRDIADDFYLSISTIDNIARAERKALSPA